MSKHFLTLSLSLLCATGTAIAQQAKSEHTSKAIKASAGTLAADKTTATDSRLVGLTSRFFDNGSLNIEDSAYFVYNTGFGYDYKVNDWKYASAKSYDFDGSNYSDAYKATRTFDGSNRITKSLGEFFDGSQWMDDEIDGYSYNTSGNIDVHLSAYNSGSNWDSTRYTNTYDANARIATQTTEQWDNGTSQWVKQMRTTNTYNTAGQLTVVLTEQWDGSNSQWENAFRVTNTYANNQLTEALNEWYMGGTWNNSQKSVYTYDANGNATQELNNYWNNNVWEPGQRLTHAYNSTNDRTSTIFENYVMGSYVNQSRVTTSYNSHHRQLVEARDSWNAALNKFEMQQSDDETRYYYEEYTNSVKDVATAAGSISVYPVPGKNTLNLRTSFTNAEAGNVILTDMGGRIVKQLQLPTAKQYNTTIDVSTLAPGNYTISVNAGGTVMTQKVVVQ